MAELIRDRYSLRVWQSDPLRHAHPFWQSDDVCDQQRTARNRIQNVAANLLARAISDRVVCSIYLPFNWCEHFVPDQACPRNYPLAALASAGQCLTIHS